MSEQELFSRSDTFPEVRVSTADIHQTTSYELQKKYYEDYVVRHPNWTLEKIYADGPVKIGLNQKHPTARGALV